MDTLLVIAVVFVLVVWWQMGSRSQPTPIDATGNAILPTNVPLLSATQTPTTTPVPAPTPTNAPPTTSYIRHQVTTGETLLSIAGQYGISVAEIQSVNNLTNEFIRAGDVLIIPVLQAVGSNSTPLLNQASISRFQYTVKAGDTVVSIAVNFGSTVDDILAANNMSPRDIIRPGDVLVVPLRAAPDAVIASAAPVATAPADTQSSAPVVDKPSIYVEPRLIGPTEKETVARDEVVLFRWISVDLLADNEWYVLLIYPDGNAAQSLPSVWTKSTSYRLTPDYAPPSGLSADYAWQVSVARVEIGVEGQIVLEAASPPSEVRHFTWQ
ncbi:MAG: LysM peptidoglycan-binding domain-containing protein [Caldilineaceae bacterium]